MGVFEGLERAAFKAGFQAAEDFHRQAGAQVERADDDDIDQAFRHWGNTA